MSVELNFHDSPIIIDDWRKDETYEGVYPSGARVKDAYFSPEKPKEDCIKSDWRYLFKLSRDRFPWQFWCEIIAYRLGCVIGITVPPAHIGLSKIYEKGEDTYAALIEWFYDDKVDGYFSGGQLMVAHIEDFDRSRGEKHNFKTIIGSFKSDESILNNWAKVLTFDTLTGNLDRHQDNWGFIVKESVEKSKMTIDLTSSPAFDNGTALGYEILEDDLYKFNDIEKLERYLRHKKARHHMKWSLEDTQAYTFFGFMKKLTVEFPNTKPIIARHLSFSLQQVEEVLVPLVNAVECPSHKLTQERLDFTLKLIFGRKRILEETLGL